MFAFKLLYQRTCTPAYTARGKAGVNTGVSDETEALSA
jgi:hypothetical protein